MPARCTRLPLAPLAQALGVTIYPKGCASRHADPVIFSGLHRIAEAFEVDHRTAVRWNLDGIPMTPERRCQVEDICDRIRRHPATIWPALDWYADEAEDDDWYGDDPALDELDPPACRSAAA